MPATVITSSPNISSLQSKVYINSCIGLFYIDLSPSVYIGNGINLVRGANVQISKFAGLNEVIIKPYGSNYEIAPGLSGGMLAPVIFSIPTISGGYQTGKYKFDVELFDSLNNRYTVSKTVNFCAPDKENTSWKYSKLSAKLIGNCQDGKLSVIVDNVPNYNGQLVGSQDNDFTLEYPTASLLPPISHTTFANFSVPLYEGGYKISGNICANYFFDDDVTISVKYTVKKEHNQKCLIDFCCVNDAFNALKSRLNSDCGDKEKANTAAIMIEALFLLENARLAAGCGEDPSDDISDLEVLLGCKCTCNCNEGTPIINNTPVADMVLEGCGFTKQTVGLTTVYTLYNYTYKVILNPLDSTGVITIEDATTSNCDKTQVFSFNISRAYQLIKQIASTDFNAWAEIISDSINGVDATCCGVTSQQWAQMTFQQRIQAAFHCACSGGSCTAKLSRVEVVQQGEKIIFTWVDDAFTESVQIMFDGNLIATVQGGIGFYEYPYTSNNDSLHSYILTPKCSNGASGEAIAGSVNVSPRVFVAAPIVYSPYLQGTIPYDLTTDVEPLPLGITSEWHTANNTNASTLVADPINANPGVYFVFAKDSNNFYSEGVQVQLVADLTGSCTAPQNLQVVPQFGGNQIKFQSAAFPPPENSYTVKRRLKSDPDVAGSYTTLGSPSWNAAISRWVISDNSAVSNELYTYRAISNCGSTAPYIDADYASIICPLLTLTPYVREIGYSFVPVGGAVSKVEVLIYSDFGATLVHTNTHNAAFSNPTTGLMLYLDQNKDYFLQAKVYIGTYVKICPLQSIKTLMDTATLTLDYIAGKWSLQLSNPVSAQLKLKVANVIGYINACITASGETDLLSSNLIIPAGSLGAELDNGGITYLSLYYKLTNSADFETYGVKTNGQTLSVGGAVVTLNINHITCAFYPA